ncbi:HU family DNA-binding protein [Mucilaginibacter sp.]|uniref:HU family DNA-binding protein n=1 Tax=Mucilaginibacter sp. TaxID=1882438 RepID=UPI002602F457|nr:HU family DNA-binding protein [Mucilaginibacter sp.]MDB4927400.1 DNA-binding protein [Mucilaginibacter sp.]
MTKAELTKEVSRKTGLEPETVMEVFQQSLATIKTTVANGEGCYFRGFGTFIPKKRAKKIGQNITKGEMMVVPEHNIAFFKPGRDFNKEMKKLKV